MQTHYILAILCSILLVVTQPGEAFMREGRTFGAESKAFSKEGYFMKANMQRRNHENDGYPRKLIRSKRNERAFLLGTHRR